MKNDVIFCKNLIDLKRCKMKTGFIERLKKGKSYKEFMDNFKIKMLSSGTENLTEEQSAMLEYSKLNLQRSLRIEKMYNVSNDLKNYVENISKRQIWLVLTEDWCGDSAQNLPYIAKIAALNDKIEFRILERDSNLDIMDLYLTNGTRSIPKLIAFDEDGNEIFTWGPRPKAAQDLVSKRKSEGASKEEFIRELHKWYSLNFGKELEKEFIEILKYQVKS